MAGQSFGITQCRTNLGEGCLSNSRSTSAVLQTETEGWDQDTRKKQKTSPRQELSGDSQL